MQKQTPWLLLAALSIVFLTSGALTTRAFAVGYNDNRNDRSAVGMTIPSGTVIPVTLDQTLSSKTNRIGDAFTVSVQSEQDGDNEFPRGTKISGVVSDVQRKSAGQPGMLDVTFKQVLLPNGQKTRIQGSVVSLDQRSVSQTSDGRIMARDTQSKDRLKFIGIGAGAGLVIGVLTKHTLLGGILGAAAGYLYGQKSTGNTGDVTVAAGTLFGIRLDSALAYNANRNYANAHDAYRRAPHHMFPDSAQAITVTMNGRAVALGNTPAFEDHGNVFIPLTPVMNAARISFTYDERQQTVLVYTDQGELFMKIGRSYALLQGEKEMLEAPAVVKNGEVFVTPGYLALATNMRVFWDASRAVTMSYDTIRNTPYPTGQDITVTLKGQRIQLGNSRPFLVDGAILVPLAPVLDAANVPYTYNERQQSIRVNTDGGTLYLNIGSDFALLDGTQTTLETPAQVVNGQVYVPIHFLSMATGLKAKWNTREQTVTLN
ncbi:MAG TPA: copper amine oxidase N-terminal domain-containing protein [Armatimonadota bacterium]|jgi:hypothetical protein